MAVHSVWDRTPFNSTIVVQQQLLLIAICWFSSSPYSYQPEYDSNLDVFLILWVVGQ